MSPSAESPCENWGTALAHANLVPILIAIGIYIIGYLLRSLRWSILLKPIRASSAIDLLWVMVIGYFANNVLPLRIGELVRAHLCGKKFHISRTASLGTILLERIFDTLSFLSTFFVRFLFLCFSVIYEKRRVAPGGNVRHSDPWNDSRSIL